VLFRSDTDIIYASIYALVSAIDNAGIVK